MHVTRRTYELLHPALQHQLHALMYMAHGEDASSRDHTLRWLVGADPDQVAALLIAAATATGAVASITGDVEDARTQVVVFPGEDDDDAVWLANALLADRDPEPVMTQAMNDPALDIAWSVLALTTMATGSRIADYADETGVDLDTVEERLRAAFTRALVPAWQGQDVPRDEVHPAWRMVGLSPRDDAADVLRQMGVDHKSGRVIPTLLFEAARLQLDKPDVGAKLLDVLLTVVSRYASDDDEPTDQRSLVLSSLLTLVTAAMVYVGRVSDNLSELRRQAEELMLMAGSDVASEVVDQVFDVVSGAETVGILLEKTNTYDMLHCAVFTLAAGAALADDDLEFLMDTVTVAARAVDNGAARGL